MDSGSTAPTKKPRGAFDRFLSTVEWLGNLLPHPVTLFALFCLGVVLVSAIASWLGVSVEDPRPEGHAGRDPSGRIAAVSLLSRHGIQQIVTGTVGNFAGFKPLGTVLVAMLGVGVAEASGFLGAVIRTIVYAVPRALLPLTIVFAGVLSNVASEMGYVVLIPLSAVIFHSMGRHPIAGLAAAFAGVSGGYSANLLIGTVDPLLSGITEEAAQIIDPEYTVNPTINYYFMFASTFLITIIGTLVTMFVVEPRLGKYDPSNAEADVGQKTDEMKALGPRERKALYAALASVVVLGIALAMTIVPESGILRDPNVSVVASPFFKGIVAIIFVVFLVPGFVYGRVVGTMKSDRDVIDAMAKSMSNLGLYMVLVFFAAQFVAYFKWTNLGLITAVAGADFLQAIGLTGPLVFVPFIFMCCFVNLMLGSASAQWAITAPIFVPMLMSVGYSPEVIQAAYRIGDSTTNTITPMMSYFGLILAFACKYDRKLGIGTLVSTMLPYSMAFLVAWILFFYLWVFGLGLPVGPETPTYYPPH